VAAGGVLRELYAALGLEVDEQSVAVGVTAVEALKKGLQLLVGVVQKTARDFAFAIVSTAEYGDKLDELADRTGLSTDALQKLAYGASFSGITMDELAASLNYLAKQGVKDVYATTLAIADQVQALKEQGRDTEASALAMEKFGRSGGALVAWLKTGKKGLKDFADEAERTGMVMSPEDIERSEKFADTLQRLGFAFDGLRREIGSSFFEPVIAGMEWATTKVRQLRAWLAELKQSIKDNGPPVKAFRFALAALAAYGFLRAIASAVSWIKYLWLMRASIIQTIALHWAQVKALVAVMWAQRATIATTALLWAAFALGFILFALLLEDLYTFATGGESYIGDLIEWLKTTAWPAIKDGFAQIWENIKEKAARQFPIIGNLILDALLWPINKAKEAFLGFLQWYVEYLGSVLAKIPGGAALAKAVGLVGEDGQAVNVASLFGGGASPAAAMAQPGAVQTPYVLAPQFRANFEVNAAQGQSEGEVANQSKNVFSDWYETKLSEAIKGVAQ